MRDRLLICNDDGIQMLHQCVPGQVEASVRNWVDFFLLQCNVDIFSFCTAFPDKTHHETTVGERYFSSMDAADGPATPLVPAQSQLHTMQCLDELAAAGTDVLHVVLDQAHRQHRRALASIRMSDVHHANDMYGFMTPDILRKHPEWRIRQADGTQDIALDYGHEGVRRHRLAIIEEIVATHEVDGIELDFMRSCRYFPRHTAASQMAVMSDFVRQVRDLLTSAGHATHLLGVRVPPSLAECPGLGLDPATWVQQGWVDYVAPSDFMWLDYGTRVEEYAAICADTDCGVYPCLNPFAAEWVNHRAVNAYTPNPVNFNRRVFFSDEQFRGCLRNYDSRGADGVYTFNFCCETIDNPQYVQRAHAVACESPEYRSAQQASWFYLPIWRQPHSPSGAAQDWRSLRFSSGERVVWPFRLDIGSTAEQRTGRLRFRLYNLHDQDELAIELNGAMLTDAAIIERRKTNIHVAADRRYPGMHIPPHIAYEIDLQNCPALAGDNELALRLTRRDPSIDSDCMLEAVEIDIGWNGTAQTVGYLT